MRSNPADYEMIAPVTLGEVVSLLASEPDQWLPIAGGTDVMVQYAAGKLSRHKLVSIWKLPELSTIEVEEGKIRIGAGCTYAELSQHELIASEFPLLRSAARWTGGIANQNRGTIGGNIANASPAADTLPALLVYDAELILVSVRGDRRMPYADFHTGYKTTLLAPDELIQSVCLPRRFSTHFSHARKVGARNTQAISKVCIAALAQWNDNIIKDVRIALGSVAPVPLRLKQTEQAIAGKVMSPELLASARSAVIAEIKPIDDIRSTARYRSAVAANLVVEFLHCLRTGSGEGKRDTEQDVLQKWNVLSPGEAAIAILSCCGSKAWAQAMVARRPLENGTALVAAAQEIWWNLTRSDWNEAFKSHPRIGGTRPAHPPSNQSWQGQSVEWSAQEQRKVSDADAAVKLALANANREYEKRFQRIFIVCATGKSAFEILEILQRRLANDHETELLEAAEQQRLITEVRLRKWLQG
jgi:OHCU decarboxylase